MEGVSFNALFDNASMGIIVADESGKIVLANPFLLKQFNYLEGELLGAPIEKLIPARFHHRHEHHVQNFSAHPKSRPMGQGMDLFAARKDGSEFPVEVSLGSYQSEDKRFVIAFLSDISKRKEAEQALISLNAELEVKVEERTASLKNTVTQLEAVVKEINEKDAELNRVNSFLQSIWAHAEAIIFVTDKQGIIQFFNPTAEKQLGYTADEVLKTVTPAAFLTREDLIEKAKELSDQLRVKVKPDFSALSIRADHGMANEMEVNYLRKDQSTFQASLTITAMKDAMGHTDGYLGIALDVSERKKAEIELRLALEKEKELSELKSRFVSMASHEFRTPLSTVLSSAYLLSKYSETKEHPKREKHVQRIVSSVNMLTDILNDFLSVGKIEEGKIQVRYTTFDIAQHIENVINELNGLFKKGQTVTFTYEGVKEVVLDPGLLKHIVMNLLSNAIKFSDEDAIIELSGRKEGDLLTLFFKDNGVGISKEDQQHLFERFFRGTNVINIQGTGLGLHIVSKYAELMNGSISCESQLNQGTTFKVTFNQ